jgi:hypothetical protein
MQAMGALVGVVAGAFFLLAGIATLADYGRFGSKTVNGIPRIFRFGTVETHRRVLGIGYLAGGFLMFVVGSAALVAYLA